MDANILIAFTGLLLTGIVALGGVVKFLLVKIDDLQNKLSDFNEISKGTHGKLFERIDSVDEELTDKIHQVDKRVVRLETIKEIEDKK